MLRAQERLSIMEALTHWEGGDPLAAAAAGRGNGALHIRVPIVGPPRWMYTLAVRRLHSMLLRDQDQYDGLDQGQVLATSNGWQSAAGAYVDERAVQSAPAL